jgi:hypothetical protein
VALCGCRGRIGKRHLYDSHPPQGQRKPQSARSGGAISCVWKKGLALFAGTEDVLRTDDHEDSTAAGEDGSILVANFGRMREASAALAEVLRPNFEGTMKRHRPEVFHGQARGGSRCVEEAVQLAHGLVENSRDHATVTVVRRSCVAPAQAKLAHELFAGFIQGKLEMHAVGIVAATPEAEVLLRRLVCAVAGCLLAPLLHAFPISPSKTAQGP